MSTSVKNIKIQTVSGILIYLILPSREQCKLCGCISFELCFSSYYDSKECRNITERKGVYMTCFCSMGNK